MWPVQLDWVSHRNGRNVFVNIISRHEQHFSNDKRGTSLCVVVVQERNVVNWDLLSNNLQEIRRLTSSSSSIDSLFDFDSSGGIIEIIRRNFSPTFIELATVLFLREDSLVLPFLFGLLLLLHLFSVRSWWRMKKILDLSFIDVANSSPSFYLVSDSCLHYHQHWKIQSFKFRSTGHHINLIWSKWLLITRLLFRRFQWTTSPNNRRPEK